MGGTCASTRLMPLRDILGESVTTPDTPEQWLALSNSLADLSNSLAERIKQQPAVVDEGEGEEEDEAGGVGLAFYAEVFVLKVGDAGLRSRGRDSPLTTTIVLSG